MESAGMNTDRCSARRCTGASSYAAKAAGLNVMETVFSIGWSNAQASDRFCSLNTLRTMFDNEIFRSVIDDYHLFIIHPTDSQVSYNL